MNKVELALTNAMNSLTEETWGKRAYFFIKDNRLCMCAHGAVQAQVNPMIEKILSQKNFNASAGANNEACAVATASDAGLAAEEGEAAVAAAAGAMAMAEEGASAAKVFSSRPSWIKEGLDAHFIMGMVGLNPVFNDHKDTTFPMIQEKFQEAIKLAQELQV